MGVRVSSLYAIFSLIGAVHYCTQTDAEPSAVQGNCLFYLHKFVHYVFTPWRQVKIPYICYGQKRYGMFKLIHTNTHYAGFKEIIILRGYNWVYIYSSYIKECIHLCTTYFGNWKFFKEFGSMDVDKICLVNQNHLQ